MRPKKLVMHAFGPYAGEQVVDFSQFADDAIFVITGPTGAGKTSIFDALCYALYGGASSEYRSSEQFKSHHSGPKQI
ncbi:MAG: AAA family ATPase, partial [Oscillospiraceae bacterium]